MKKNPDEIMDDLAAELETMIDRQADPETSIFVGLDKWKDNTWRWVLMVEAHQAGKDPMLAKLQHENGEIAAVSAMDRVARLAPAMAYASDWQAKRAAA